jgi:hypothetical protein
LERDEIKQKKLFKLLSREAIAKRDTAKQEEEEVSLLHHPVKGVPSHRQPSSQRQSQRRKKLVVKVVWSNAQHTSPSVVYCFETKTKVAAPIEYL